MGKRFIIDYSNTKMHKEVHEIHIPMDDIIQVLKVNNTLVTLKHSEGHDSTYQTGDADGMIKDFFAFRNDEHGPDVMRYSPNPDTPQTIGASFIEDVKKSGWVPGERVTDSIIKAIYISGLNPPNGVFIGKEVSTGTDYTLAEGVTLQYHKRGEHIGVFLEDGAIKLYRRDGFSCYQPNILSVVSDKTYGIVRTYHIAEDLTLTQVHAPMTDSITINTQEQFYG